MAQLAFGVAGAAIGSKVSWFTAGQGLAGGAIVGSLVQSFLNQPDDIIQRGSDINTQLTTTSSYGKMRPISYGTITVTGNVIDGSTVYKTEHRNRSDVGGKGGLFGSGQEVVEITYTASIDLAVALGEGEIDVLQIYANDRLIYDVTPDSIINSPDWLNLTIYRGTEDQLPDPTLQVLHGDDTPAYRGEAYVVFTKFQLADFGNQIPSFRFTVVRNVTPEQSQKTINFNNGDNFGTIVYSRYSGLLYYFCNGQPNSRIGYIYDSRSEQDIVSIRWPDNVGGSINPLDEDPSAGLFGLPVTTLENITIPSAANSNFFISIQDDTGQPGIAVYDSFSGTYLGNLIFSTIYDGSNTKIIISDEREGIVYRVHFNSFVQFFYLESWQLELNQTTTGVVLTTNTRGIVEIPIENREGINEWEWNMDGSYPEGTTREGILALRGTDLVDSKDYLCLINGNDNAVENILEMTEYFYRDNYAICWDSVQEYFWVMGQSSTAGRTRIKAFDLDLQEQYNEEWNDDFYAFSKEYYSFDPETTSIWMYKGTTLYKWSTIDYTFETYINFPTGVNGNGDNLVYVHFTKSAWIKRGNGNLYVNRIGRLNDSAEPLSAVVDDLCQRAQLQPSEYDVTNLTGTVVEGYTIIQDGDIRNKLAPLQQTYLFDGIDKADLIDFQFRGQSSVANIADDDLGVSDNKKIKINRMMDLDLPKKTEVTYFNRELEYEKNTQMARRSASYVKENSSRVVLPLVLTDDEGIRLADTLEHLAHIEREIYEINVLPKWQHLVNGDVVNIQYNNRNYLARIISKNFENGYVKFTLTKEDSSVLNSFLNGGSAPGRNVSVRYNALTYSVHLDIPLLSERHNNAGYYLSACGYNEEWPGGNIYKSENTTAFSLAVNVLSASKIGNMDQAIGFVPDHVLWDRDSTAVVYMICGELESKPEEEVLKGENTCVIGAHGRWEVISFANVTLLEPGVYQLDTFIRGRLGTEWAIGTHELGDTFCFLSVDDLSYINDSLSNLNLLYLYRAVTLGENLYGNRVIDQFHINTGVCLKPYAPSQFQGEKNPTTLDIKFTWMPRTRFIWRDYWSGIASDPENFEIQFTPQGGSLQTYSATGTEFLYTRAQQITDGFPSDDIEAANFDIYQISDSVGNGYKATTVVGVGPEVHPMVSYAVQIGANIIYELAETSGTVAIDLFGNNNGNYNHPDSGGLPTLGQPSLLPSGYKTSVEFDQALGMISVDLPTANFGGWLNWSIAFLFQPQESPANEGSILKLKNSNTDIDIRWLSNSNLRVIKLNFSGANKWLDSTAATSVGQTYLVVFTFNATDYEVPGNAKFYINGVLNDSDTADVPAYTFDDLGRLELGWSTTSFGTLYANRQQEIMIFNHELTQQEVTNLYITSGL